MTTYTAAIAASVKDTAGNELAASHTWSFTTRDLNWSFVDGNGTNGINKDVTKDASGQNSFVEFNNKLYFAWSESLGTVNNNNIRVTVYNGNDSSPTWRFIDGDAVTGINKDTSKLAVRPRLMVFNNKLYITWDERDAVGDHFQVRVKVYNGNDSSPSWSFVDGGGTYGINKNPNLHGYFSFPYVFDDKLYVTWNEGHGVSTDDQIRVAVFNGSDSSPVWSFVDGDAPVNGLNKDTTKNATSPKLITLNNKLYLGWQESNGTAYQIRMTVYNGNDSSPTWKFIDGDGTNGLNKNTSISASMGSLVILGNKLYLNWSESNGTATQVRQVVYNGDDSYPGWTFIDGNGLNKNSLKNAARIRSLVINDRLYLAWDEYDEIGNIDQIRVKAYNGNDASPSWAFVDGGGTYGINKDSSKTANFVCLGSFLNKLYINWIESNGIANQVRIKIGQ